ncbi:red chlorophyll catabolite reductase [Tolypothrix sp. PCC 7910]|uniref:red chlorophyll catabolite reductase n=1 Tax=Tolypothrix sp. PCC 7910 TaxID=2099387 RepID=UPI001427752E|nr:red chlorophyll catabolite reductase [Tolypothrix sp. PCC 7910]QIR36209.1 red chlorophyll catabolite reductase [Tolypothrix sp. PCC 7910]
MFDQLWSITQELRQKLQTRFEFQLDPSTADLGEYSSLDGNIKGSLSAYTGREIDWLVNAWMGNPVKSNFSTMRLTIWLGSHILVPHLAFEFSTTPNLFFFIDYISRTDLLSNWEYLERYYEPVNQTFLKLQADPRLTLFTSKSVYIRLFQSPVSLCYTALPTEDSIELIRAIAHEMLDRWLVWVEEAEPVPENTREALADRDLGLRRSSAERDPGNKIAVDLFGEELTDKLVRSLWGGDRILKGGS